MLNSENKHVDKETVLMANLPDSEMSGVHWAATSKEAPVADTSTGLPDEFDLTVVGAGFCGLSVALSAAKAGLSVLLLEAGRIGCGASGRNGGLAVPHFPGATLPGRVEAKLGKHRSGRLFDLVRRGPSIMYDRIRDYGIECDAEQNGWIQPAHSEKSLGLVRNVFDEWTARGSKATWLDRAALHDRTGATGYLGGWLDETGGTVNPYALALGLGRAAQYHGVHIRQQAPVQTIRCDGAVKILRAGGKEFRARKVVITTNAYTHDLYPRLSRSIIPVRLFHTFTRPLTQEEQISVLPGRVAFTDLRKSGGFARLDATNRLLSGGAIFTLSRGKPYSLSHSRRRIAELFPKLKGIEIESYWEGYCALSQSFLPSIHELDEGVYSVLGFSTRGVALAQTLGREIGRFLAESLAEADLPIGVTALETVPFQRSKTFLGGFAFPVYQARDALGLT